MSGGVWERRVAGILFWVLFALVMLAQVAIVAPEFWMTRLWEDEAFNLTVPLNLLAGHGYSSAGLLGSGTVTPFDVRISTGPVVLLPVAAVLSTGTDPVVGGRLVSLIFYAGLLVALWLLGRRFAGRWGALFAVFAPLALDTNQLPSPVQGPIDILGEFPAAALIAWSIVCVRRRPWLAGLFLGLAIQTKFISLLAAPALLVYLWFLVTEEPWRPRLKRCVWFTAWAAAPTVLYWIVVLVSLGPIGFGRNVYQFLAFLHSGGQIASVPVDQKLNGLAISWFLDTAWVIAIIIAAIVVGVLAVMSVRLGSRRGVAPNEAVQAAGARTSAREIMLLLIAAAVNLVAWVGWWTLSRGTPTWIRYPTTGLVVSIPMFAAAVVLGARMLWVRALHRARPAVHSGELGAARRLEPHDGPAPEPISSGERWFRWTAAGVATALCLGIVVSTGISVQRHAAFAQVPDYGETLSQQRDVAHRLAQLGDREFAAPWGSQLGAIVLSGVPSTNLAGPNAGNLRAVLWTPDLSEVGQAAFDKLVKTSCAPGVVRVATQYVVCWLR